MQWGMGRIVIGLGSSDLGRGDGAVGGGHLQSGISLNGTPNTSADARMTPSFVISG